MINIILLALTFAEAALKSAEVNGAPVDIVDYLKAAVDALRKVHGTDVTFGQIDSLKAEHKW